MTTETAPICSSMGVKKLIARHHWEFLSCAILSASSLGVAAMQVYTASVETHVVGDLEKREWTSERLSDRYKEAEQYSEDTKTWRHMVALCRRLEESAWHAVTRICYMC